MKIRQLYFEGNIVYTYWDEKGFSSSKVKTEKHTQKRQGIVTKVTYQECRKTFSLCVNCGDGIFITEQEDVTHIDNHPDRQLDKVFNIQFNVGKCKYVINYHNGIKRHPDGSKFFDIDVYSNKKKFELRQKQLLNLGYKYKN